MSYLIRETRHFFAGTVHTGRVRYFGVHGFDPLAPLEAFATKEAARAAIQDAKREIYLLGNGEHSRPTLVAVPLHRCPQHVIDAARLS